MRVVFFGTPDFAVPTLRALVDDARFEVALVVTQGAKSAAPVEREATVLGLPVYKPPTLRDEPSRAPLVAAEADLFIVAAFGLIFRERTLEIPRLGSVNVHPSLLPKYRGASPVMAAVAAGDRETGVSLMLMDAGIDTGAVISAERAVVADDDTTESLTARLAAIGAGQTVRDVPRWLEGELAPVAQTNAGASLTRPLTKADGWLDWKRPAPVLERHVRAMWPWPRAWTTVEGVPMQIHGADVVGEDLGIAPPGTVIAARRRLMVACGEGALELLVVEPAGRRPMSAGAYLNGRRSPLLRVGAGGEPLARRPLVVPVELATDDEGR